MLFVLFAVLVSASLYFWVTTRAHAAKPKSISVSVGPWGRLETTRYLLQKPAELLPPPETQPLRTLWHFPGRNKAEVESLLTECGLTPAQRNCAMRTATNMPAPAGVQLTPPTDVLLELSPAARDKLYAELEKSPLNVPQAAPFTIQAADADIWFSKAGLPASQISRLRQLTYRRGTAVCFCDLEAAQGFLSESEFKGLIKALYSTDTLRARVAVPSGSSVDSLVAYWGRGGRRSEIQALLESVSAVPGGVLLDVVELLPPLARGWITAYPDAPPAGVDAPDCFYTSLNFFRKTPEARFLQPEFRNETFRKDYQTVPKAEELGDIIVFVDSAGGAQHACVYIADDIVFTKNGVQRTHPWVLMRMAAVKAIYARDTAATQIVFRAKSKD